MVYGDKQIFLLGGGWPYPDDVRPPSVSSLFTIYHCLLISYHQFKSKQHKNVSQHVLTLVACNQDPYDRWCVACNQDPSWYMIVGVGANRSPALFGTVACNVPQGSFLKDIYIFDTVTHRWTCKVRTARSDATPLIENRQCVCTF